MHNDRSAEEGGAGVLNENCFCVTLDRAGLAAAIGAQAQDPDFISSLLLARPQLFSNVAVFLSRGELDAMLEVIAAVEAAAENAAYQEEVLRWAPPIASHDFGPRGVFMGYDFHLGESGPSLIEVNTNAGGAFLNALLARAQRSCCREADSAGRATLLDDFDAAVWQMFLAEWELQRRSEKLQTVAVVDDAPEGQYLYPEFLVAQRFFERQGAKAWILDPSRLEFSDGRLQFEGETINLVYNRLVDFALETSGHEALRAAYLDGAVVVSPSPRNHALFADKRNLSLLSDAATAAQMAPAHRQSLSAIPRTVIVTPDNADVLWTARKDYFFKPVASHGGKAVYRGDKLTRRVWDQIRHADYVAQAIARPSERKIRIDGETRSMKLDVRIYTYRGVPILTAARVYQGQTTNFRTPGGGFAPVFVV